MEGGGGGWRSTNESVRVDGWSVEGGGWGGGWRVEGGGWRSTSESVRVEGGRWRVRGGLSVLP